MSPKALLCVVILVTAVPAGFVNGLANSVVLDAAERFHVSWEFTEADITFEVTVQTKGYVGLGFSPNGDMPGSDIVIGWVDDTNGKGHISDQYATAQSTPKADTKQDYTLLASSQNATHTQLSFKRPIKLCDSDDYYIKDETVRLIWAYNDKDPSADGTPSYHFRNRGSKSLYLINPPTVAPSMPDDVIYEEFLNPSVPIPVVDTTYWCQAFPVPRLSTKHHVIKIEPIITPGLEAEVHHILLYGCLHETSNTTHGKGHSCYEPNMPGDFRGCSAIIYGWAVGGGPLYFPPETGLPFGYDEDPTMILMETHFDNPQLKTGLVDSSGFRMTLTPTLRAHDAGMLEMGVSVSPTQVIPPFASNFRSNGHCYPECLEQAMANSQENLTAFGYILHSHLIGHAMRLRHFREGRELPRLAEDNAYDFNFQEFRLLKPEVKIIPGDHFVMECDYRTDDRTTVTYGGLSTRNEMCLGFVMYYPRIRLSKCMSRATYTYVASALEAEMADNGTILSPLNWAGQSLFDVIENEVDWNSSVIRGSFEEASNMEGVDGFFPICNNGKTKYPIMGKTKPRPKATYVLPEDPNKCDSSETQKTNSGTQKTNSGTQKPTNAGVALLTRNTVLYAAILLTAAGYSTV